jgi:hypothetical protein
MKIPEDVQKAIDRLKNDADLCDRSSKAAYFWTEAKAALAQDIRTVLRFIEGLPPDPDD